MGIISWDDFRRGILAIFIIVPTIISSIYFSSALQSYGLTGADLWGLQRKDIPNDVIEPLLNLRSQKYFFKYKLMHEIKSRISNQELFQRYEQEIENQISIIPHHATEYFFLGFLVLIFGVFGYIINKLFPDDII